MTVLRDVSILYCFLHSLILFAILFKPRYTMKKTLFLTASLMIPLLLLNFLIIPFVGFEKMGTLVLLTCSIPSMIFFFIISKYRDGRFFFVFCFSDSLIFEIIYITSIIDHMFGGTYIVMFVLRIIACIVLEIFAFKFIRPMLFEIQEHVRRGWTTFTMIAAAFYILITLAATTPTIVTERPEYIPAFILLLVLIPVIYFHIFTSLINQHRIHEQEKHKHILEVQMNSVLTRAEEFYAADEKFRIERHDFIHKLNIIATLINEKQYDKLQNLVSEYIEGAKIYPPKRYCDDIILDAVLATYLQKAESKNIKVIVHLDFPDVIPVNNAELSVVLANAIENAINASDKLSEEKRQIEIQVLKLPCFMVQISNNFDGNIVMDKEGLPVSLKKDHGYGTRSIAAFCQKYNAFYEFKVDDEKFSIRISFCQ